MNLDRNFYSVGVWCTRHETIEWPRPHCNQIDIQTCVHGDVERERVQSA